MSIAWNSDPISCSRSSRRGCESPASTKEHAIFGSITATGLGRPARSRGPFSAQRRMCPESELLRIMMNGNWWLSTGLASAEWVDARLWNRRIAGVSRPLDGSQLAEFAHSCCDRAPRCGWLAGWLDGWMDRAMKATAGTMERRSISLESRPKSITASEQVQLMDSTPHSGSRVAPFTINSPPSIYEC